MTAADPILRKCAALHRAQDAIDRRTHHHQQKRKLLIRDLLKLRQQQLAVLRELDAFLASAGVHVADLPSPKDQECTPNKHYCIERREWYTRGVLSAGSSRRECSRATSLKSNRDMMSWNKLLTMPIPNSPRTLVIELNRENDGRWIADIPEFPGVLVYSSSQNQAIANVQALALRALANQIEAQGIPQPVVQFTTRAAWRFSESVPANGLVTG